MAKLRSVNTKFWDDPFVVELTPTEKLLFLYLITNSLTNLLGIYEISLRKISFDTGIKEEMVRKALERFGTVGKAFFIKNYIVLPNWLKNQNLNSNMRRAVEKEFDQLPNWMKNKVLSNHSEGLGNDYLTIRKGLETIRDLNRIEIEVENESKGKGEDGPSESHKIHYEIIQYLNEKSGKTFKPQSDATKRLINARIKDGFFLDDLKKVIDNKCRDWKADPKMNEYLRPQTLFGTKFEAYLNQNTTTNGNELPTSEEHENDRIQGSD